jgi:hypothetical protein
MADSHDNSGHAATPPQPQTQDMTFWEKQIDALHTLIGDDKRHIVGRDENRRAVESVGDDVYDTMNYYERWTAATCRQLIDKGILTQAEIDARIAEIRNRIATEGKA